MLWSEGARGSEKAHGRVGESQTRGRGDVGAIGKFMHQRTFNPVDPVNPVRGKFWILDKILKLETLDIGRWTVLVYR
jgi:hypothetical protein